MTAIAISNRLQRVAQGVAARQISVLERRKLEAPFSGFYLTEVDGLTLLISALDTGRINRLEAYTDADLLHQISTEVALPVFLSNHVGLRYVTLLSAPPRMPKLVNLPTDIQPGQVALGVKAGNQPLSLSWGRMGHVLTAGMTGSGKSVFLRNLVFQALRDGMALLLADIDQATFPMLADNPNLLAPLATTPGEAIELVERALGECDARAALFQAAGGFPENLEQYNEAAVRNGLQVLPRVLVVLDEFSAVAAAAPAIKDRIASLGWRARKFGLTVVFAAQEFTKDLIGPLRDQVSLAVCFRVRSADMARRVNCTGAEHIPASRPGLAYVDRWGPVQTYFVDKGLLMGPSCVAIPEPELQWALRAQRETAGRMSIPLLITWGCREREARRLLDAWELRGWVQRDPRQQNARVISPKMGQILSISQTCQTPSSLSTSNKEKES
ncbi:MAG TPA: FtsK/SpoIIIE domain-containing protein [Anaerolineaceae bacterium]|nr:FtsK/SpoIIIE domain-containing protein [Anaerolineaceae bacterium]HQH85570.1 FtsK/SpoIIIE domain-containing protein [Anaerolineaceae bacterium]